MRRVGIIQCIAALVFSIWTIGQAFADDKPSVWSVLKPKPFGHSANEIFERVDENGDGKFDEVELRLHKMALFDERDANRDDVLDKKEAGHLSSSTFAAFDKNGDGKISAFEYHQSHITNLSTIDANKDGTVSREEFRAYLDSIQKK